MERVPGGGGFHLREEGQGPPLLLIHGTGGHADVFAPVIGPLSRRFRVIAYDRRGYSRSAAPPHPAAGYLEAHARDALAVLESRTATPAAVLGWSAGALVALHLARLAPQAVSRLVLYEPPLHVKSNMNLPLAARFVTIMLLGALGFRRRAALIFFRMALGYAAGGNGFDRLPAKDREPLLANAAALLAELAAGTGEELTTRELQGIACPVALILGGNTAPFLAAATERLAAAIPQAALHRVPGASHLMQIEQPETFVEVVLRALAAGTAAQVRSSPGTASGSG